MAQKAQTIGMDEGAEMLARHIAGDTRAFGELVERFSPMVYGYLLRSGVGPDAKDDLFQETFMRVHVSARRYNPEYPFRVWLFTITNNLIRSHFRKQKVRRIFTSLFKRKFRNRPYDDPEPDDPVDESADVAGLAEARSRSRWLEEALGRLPEGSRQALLLTQVEGMSHQEAARSLKVPVPTLKTWIRRGRLSLAQALEREEEDEK